MPHPVLFHKHVHKQISVLPFWELHYKFYQDIDVLISWNICQNHLQVYIWNFLSCQQIKSSCTYGDVKRKPPPCANRRGTSALEEPAAWNPNHLWWVLSAQHRWTAFGPVTSSLQITWSMLFVRPCRSNQRLSTGYPIETFSKKKKAAGKSAEIRLKLVWKCNSRIKNQYWQ